ncbi:MAG TPA: SDR family oxidoreductase [Acidimicrobiales bacterium]|jgi:3-oxoacyl-[acyl-carrier protein] reductase|nr:SDR family oxidoreductase [Acidimicrobiales bacterium]
MTASDERPLEQQWAAITGGSKGIGLGIAEELVRAGANVILAARNRDALHKAQAQVQALAGEDQTVDVCVTDIESGESIAALFDHIAATAPRLNVLVANAGAGRVTPFLELTRQDWEWAINLNLTGTFDCVRRAAATMVEHPGTNRSIIVVSSIRGIGARPGVSAYGVAKAGLNQLVRIAGYELAEHQVRVNGLLPGITETPLTRQNPDVFARMSQTVPMGRAGTPGDMAAAARFLASPASSFVTGTNVVVDGGEHLW